MHGIGIAITRGMTHPIQFLGTSLFMLLIVAAAAQASAQEPYKLSAELSRGTIPTKHVSMDSMMAVPKRDALGESPVASDLHATLLDRPVLSEDSHGVKETRESILEQIAAAGGAFARGLKSASSRCTGWQNGGIEQPWIGPDPMMERACVFQFELPTK